MAFLERAFLERMVAVSTAQNINTAVQPGPVCSVCPLYPTCREICEPVEQLLPSMERARVDSDDLPRLFMGMRMTNLLLDHISILTPHQQEVVRLYYREALQQHEIAELLQVTQQAVHDTLLRARQAVGRTLSEKPQKRPVASTEYATQHSTKRKVPNGVESRGATARSRHGSRHPRPRH